MFYPQVYVITCNYFKSLLFHLKKIFKAKYLVGTVDKCQLIRTDSACRDLIDEAKNYLLLPQERGQMQGPRTKPRRAVNPYEEHCDQINPY